MFQDLKILCFRNGIVLSLLLILIFPVADYQILAVAQSTDVHIIDLVFETDEYSGSAVMGYKYGLNASLSSRNFSFAGRKVDIIPKEPKPNEVALCINETVQNSSDLFIVLGPASALHTIDALPALRGNSIIGFGPITDLTSAHIWDKHLYFFSLRTALSAHALLRHALINMRLRRIGFMYTTNVSFGDSEYEHVENMMRVINREVCGVFRIDGRKSYAVDDDEFNNKWEAFAKSRPQAVIMISLPNPAAELFVKQLLKDSRTRTAYLMLTFHMEVLTLGLWETARTDGAPVFPGQVFTTRAYPSPSDRSSAMVRKYRSVVEKYFQRVNEELNGQTEVDSDRWSRNGATLSGWILGEILFYALSGFSASLRREDFISALFSQRSYIIGDYFVGTFGGEISDSFAQLGLVARCNEGSTTAYIRRYLARRYKVEVPEGDYRRPLYACDRTRLSFFDSAGIVMVNITDFGSTGAYLVREIHKGQRSGVSLYNSTAKHDISVKVLQSKHANATSTVQKEAEEFWTNIVTGLIDVDALDIPSLMFLDPIVSVAQMNKFRRNTIFLSPTVEEQIFVLAEYVASLPDSTIHAVIRGGSPEESLEMVEKSLLTFGATLTSSVLLSVDTKIENEIASSGLTLMIDVNEEDVPIFFTHLEQNTEAQIVILYNPLLAFYDKLCALFNGTEAAGRLILITTLPHWAEVNSSSPMVRGYHKEIRDPSAWSPMSLRSFITGRVIGHVVETLETVSWSSVIDYFYLFVAVNVDGMKFGPFADKDSVTCTSASDHDSYDCARNFGATEISVWSLSRVFDPSVGVLFGPVTHTLEYRVAATGISTGQLIEYILGSFAGVVLLIALIIVVIKCFCTGNTNAPRKDEHPVTLIFTDIQSSTALWAACPLIMPGAVDTHHRLIRRLIAKYRCYEVKTVGDSFMIACKNPYAAVQLVDELQRTFLHHDWGTNAIDEAYREFEKNWAEEDADYEPPTALLGAAGYRAHWRGLRVRVGVHTGLADIRYDEVTERYDYYGSLSNTAARTESIANGGQVLLTRAAFMALSTTERAGLDVTALGAVELRGVHEPVEMLQLNAVPGRTFAALRLERGNDNLDLDTSTVCDTETSGSESEMLSPAAENILTVLDDICAAFPPQQRLEVLEPFCKQWHVAVPVGKNKKKVVAACHLAKQRLAMRVSRVIERRQVTHEGITVDSDIISSSMRSLCMQNSTRASPFGVNVWHKGLNSKQNQDSEGYYGSPCASFKRYPCFSPLSVLSTSSIHMREPPNVTLE